MVSITPTRAPHRGMHRTVCELPAEAVAASFLHSSTRRRSGEAVRGAACAPVPTGRRCAAMRQNVAKCDQNNNQLSQQHIRIRPVCSTLPAWCALGPIVSSSARSEDGDELTMTVPQRKPAEHHILQTLSPCVRHVTTHRLRVPRRSIRWGIRPTEFADGIHLHTAFIQRSYRGERGHVYMMGQQCHWNNSRPARSICRQCSSEWRSSLNRLNALQDPQSCTLSSQVIHLHSRYVYSVYVSPSNAFEG
jgi:hypothetical protein